MNVVAQTSTYRPDIDGLRAIAVMAVVINHLSPELLPGGYVGVDVFFVISGYLITRIILTEVQRGDFTIAGFYERRVRRIIPALFVMLATVAVVGWFILLPSDYLATFKALGSTVFFASNIFFWRDADRGYFAATDASLNPLLHTWSLGVEEQFYLAFPIFILLVHRYLSSYLKVLLWFIFFISLLLSVWLIGSKSVAVFFLTPFRAWELLAGSLLAVNAIPSLRKPKLNTTVGLLGLVALGIALLSYNDKTTFPGLTALLPVMGTVAVIYAGPKGPAGQLLSLRPMIFLGLISYSLYLWHWPLMVLIRYSLNHNVAGPASMVGLLVLSLIFAWLSWRFVETPFRHRQITVKSIYRVVSLAAIGLLVVAGAGYVSRGFEARVSHQVLAYDKMRSPDIPFISCDGRVDQPCMLGDFTAPTSEAILIGDSHLLAWAPAFDVRLKAAGQKAKFYPHSSCPPFFDLGDNHADMSCVNAMMLVKREIQSLSKGSTIVLSAYWPTYFKEDGPLAFNGVSGDIVASAALHRTVSWLLQQGHRVFFIGPVPVFKRSIPMSHAKNAMHKAPLEDQDITKQLLLNSDLMSALAKYENHEKFTFLDPISWLCKPQCQTEDRNGLFYRDAHHLSVHGALTMKELLTL